MKKYIKYTIIIIIACLITIGTKYGLSYAKYAYNSVWNYYLKSKGFYFNSNTLTQNQGKIVDNLWDGGHVYFDLNNALNEGVASENDISYKVTCTVKESKTPATCTILESNNSTYEGVLSTFKTCINNKDDGVDVKKLNKASCEIGGYSWQNEPAIKEIYFDVQGTDSATVEINVTSITPYKKTLKAEFILNKDQKASGEVLSDYNDKDTEGTLTLSNSYDENKCIKISWNPNNLKIDLDKNKITSYATDSSGYINEINIKMNPKSSEAYNYYKVNSNTYTESDFTITELEKCD